MGSMYNAVFEGGGVRGIAHVGAANVFEKKGYRMMYLVGSSVGALVAALYAAGYSSDELKKILEEMDFSLFKEEGIISSLGFIGKMFSVFSYYGIYKTDTFEQWLEGLLAAKGITKFRDLRTHESDEPCEKKWKLQITASDLTDQRLLILPQDLEFFGLDPDEFSVAKAVRMSISIPIFYKPYKLIDSVGKPHLIVDGGLLSNYPVWMFDEMEECRGVPTIGYKFFDNGNATYECQESVKHGDFLCYLKLLVQTTLKAADKQHVAEDRGCLARTVLIPVTIEDNGKQRVISAVDFDMTDQEKQALYNNGEMAAKKFLRVWDYDKWVREFMGIMQQENDKKYLEATK